MTDLVQLAHDVEVLREDVDCLLLLNEPTFTCTEPGGGGGATVLSFPTRTATGTPTRPTAAHVWHRLKPAEAAAAWTELVGWVDWLTDRYQLDDTLPGCWYRHGALIEELDALRAAWEGAYREPTAPADPANWHQLLAQLLARIREWNRYGCAAGTHHDETTVTGTDVDRDTRERYLQADIQMRPAPHRPLSSEGGRSS